MTRGAGRRPSLVLGAALGLGLGLMGCAFSGQGRLGTLGQGDSGAGGTSALAGNSGGALAGNSGGALAGNSGGALAGNSGGALAGNSGGALGADIVAAFSGLVSGPAALAGNSGGALVGNSGGALAGNSGGALAGNSGGALAGNSGGAYRLLALLQEPLGGAFVYLTNPDERFFALGGKPLTTTTGRDGRYDFGAAVLPENLYVVVNALLPGNRRLVGFTVGRKGLNEVNVDGASTFVLEFLRSEARRSGKTFARFDLGLLPALTDATRALIADGRLVLRSDDLVVGDSRRLVDAYAVAFLEQSPQVTALWEQLLGYRPRAVMTVAGTHGYGPGLAGEAPGRLAAVYYPSAVAVGGQIVYVATQVGHQVLALAASGTASAFTAPFEGDPTALPAPPVPADGADFRAVPLPQPVGLAADKEGNLFVTMNSTATAPRHTVLLLAADGLPKFGRDGLQAGRVYRLTSTLEPQGDLTGFANPTGLAVDDGGNLYVADQENHRVVRVDRTTGVRATVAGAGPGFPPAPLIDGVAPALNSGLLRPSAVAWRRAGADEQLFVLDTLRQRVREVTAPGGDWSKARMRTLAGAGSPVPAGNRSVVVGAFGGDGGAASSARLHLARAAVDDWAASERSVAGLALDAAGSRLFLADTNNGRIRAIDLASGVITTWAGGGTNPRDGLATGVDFAQPLGLAVTAAGEVIVADGLRHAIRKVTP